MSTITFKNILGYFTWNEHGKLIDRKPRKEKFEPKALLFLREHCRELRDKNIELTETDLRESVSEDVHIAQGINAIDEWDKVINILTTRLREWVSYFFPEFEHKIHDNRKFAELFCGRLEPTKMGGELKQRDKEILQKMAMEIKSLFIIRDKLDIYLNKRVKALCPNMCAVAGYMLTARLISHAGSIKRLALMPASTIQMLGAEKALFRHLKNKRARCPKYGYIFGHPVIMKAKSKGKAARAVADKLSMAVKIDYFKGNFIGDKLREELEEN